MRATRRNSIETVAKVSSVIAALISIALPGIGGCASGGRTVGSSGSPFGKKKAGWTIRCIELSGPAAPTQIAQLAETLKRTQGIRAAQVYTFTDAEKTGLYYGRYHRKTNPKTGRRNMPAAMRSDLNLIKQLGDGRGHRFFLGALPARVPTRDVGNPAWNLKNVEGTYSLQVAAFEPTDEFFDFKQAAADYCSYLRGKGFEAYYDHSEGSSVVTVGIFGSDAFAIKPTGRRYLHQYSDEVARLQQNELLKYNLVNGGIVYVVHDNGTRSAVPSFLVEIPKKKSP